ncbi:vWA domain-containing protein, partial [Treponema sp. R6D11]
MKKNIFLVLLLLFTIVCAYGQNASPADIVLLLDTSSTMSSSYENVNNYITGDFLNEFLRVGDTFHLIAFSGNSRLDVARRISGLGDVETIIGRMLLQYPVENGSNISSALSYAEQYITTLPSRPKKIVLVSVGGSDTNNLVNASKQRLNSKNATLDYIQVTPGRPLSNLPKSGRPAAAKVTTATKPTSSGGNKPASSGSSGQTSTTANSGATSGTTTGTGTSAAGGSSVGTNTTTGSSTWEESNYDSQGQNAVSGSNANQQSAVTSSNTDNYSSDNKDTKNYISAEERARNRNESYSSSLPFILLVIILILLL